MTTICDDGGSFDISLEQIISKKICCYVHRIVSPNFRDVDMTDVVFPNFKLT